ncbi:hypothetical protein BH23GEM3_BH23GEM3_21650 [soil metagenome]|jgi:hypothetical protein|nr:hypothetical protein [Gemmatimonadota bacterium]
MSDQEHHSTEEQTHGMALGFRIFEHEGDLYFAEAEIAAYVDDAESLGATLVFHKLSGIDPTSADESTDWPAWSTDIDDELTRTEGGPIPAQFDAILRQLSKISEEELRTYLQRATEETDDMDEEG